MEEAEANSEFEFIIAEDLRSETDGWPGWEIERTRSLYDPKTAWTNPDDHDVSSQYRNQRLVLTKTRASAAFTAKIKYSIETRTGKYRIVPENRLVLKILGKKKVLAQLKLTGLLTSCHDWLEQSWEGTLPPEAFELVDDIIIHADNVPIRRC